MKRFGLIAIGLIGLFLYSSLYVVYEGQRAIKVRFAAVLKDSAGTTAVFEPGLHFKVPLIDKVRILDARIQTLDGEPDRFVTSEKKDLIVDSYVKWRIKDFSTYYLRTGGGNKFQAENLLKQKISDGLRSSFGTRTISEIVSGERSELMNEALLEASSKATDIGIELVDMRVKQIELPQAVRSSIYQRMRAEREAVAKEHRSKGKEQSEKLRADIDAKVAIMLATADSQARITRGEGDAQAARIYADAYGKDPEFFSFIRSMDAYKRSFNNNNDIMVVKPDNDFFKYMKNPQSEK
ncbi:protease modulator HflC [Psychrobium sp. 1_MG-2023]|uniref:protease modulator HflC n=1 Tax=Psychrobium sp. 1_MG-2023 TaxID=3062624 RepID=UPI000C32A6A4|nr:protease modulator HflC [Psychrobium sp. 1_MG-2023]MDP2559728.1 protease modulator HflC [Psychrobium sp. 1_MG-2023]PKF59557.1 protease modulator HflC [Alteromonadales bacterium alter-6D02]